MTAASGVDPDVWDIRPRGGTDKVTAGARVPPPVGAAWRDAVARVASETGTTKGDAAAVGLLIAMENIDAWLEAARRVGASTAARDATDVHRLLRGEVDMAELWTSFDGVRHLLAYLYATDKPGRYRVTNTVNTGYVEATSDNLYRSRIVDRHGGEQPLSVRRPLLYAVLAAVGGDGVPDRRTGPATSEAR